MAPWPGPDRRACPLNAGPATSSGETFRLADRVFAIAAKLSRPDPVVALVGDRAAFGRMRALWRRDRGAGADGQVSDME